MSILQRIIQSAVRRVKRDPDYRIESRYSKRQLLIVLWHRVRQLIRGYPLRLRVWGVRGKVFRGRRVVIEHARQLRSGPGLVLEDGAFISALSTDGVTIGRNVTIARGAILTCTGVLARLGKGIRIGERSAVGAGCFLGGQGGIDIGREVIIGPGVRIFSENHRFESLDQPIREQGEERLGVTIGNDCWIGAGATILDGVTIASGCVVAAGAVVTNHLPPFCVAAGVPARVIRWRQPGERLPQGSAPAPPLLVERSPDVRALRGDP